MSDAAVAIRPAVPGDEHALFELVRQLAVFERLEHAVTGSAALLARDLFGERPKAEALLAVKLGKVVGFALFFTTYSTFLTRAGIYLEDVFVVESERRSGIGKALFSELIRISAERGAGRLEWSVLDWNENAIAFYERLGAKVLPDWRICRMSFDSR